MKRNLTLISAAFTLSAAFLLGSCGNDNNNTTDILSDETKDTTSVLPDGKVDIAKEMVFKVNFADYNSDETLQTRAGKNAENDIVGKEVVELGNGLLAEVTVKKDTENLKQDAVITRALADNTYTMLAYQGRVLKGTLKGKIKNGVFTSASSESKAMQLDPGEYDFVLFSSAVSQNGNLLTVNRADVDNAFVGRTTYTVTSFPTMQDISFDMQRHGARAKIKLTNYVKPTTINAVLSSVNSTDIPAAAIYDASTGTWTHQAGDFSQNLSFSSPQEQTEYIMDEYTETSGSYVYLLSSTDPSKLRITFTGGTVYNLPVANKSLNFSHLNLNSIADNGSYVFNVTLIYNFRYLMSDGTVGFFPETIYNTDKDNNPIGTKTPIALVIDKDKGLAVTLHNANNNNSATWFEETRTSNGPNLMTRFNQKNNVIFHKTNDVTATLGDMNGYEYTWESSGSLDGAVKVTSMAEKYGRQVQQYPAFYYAGKYSEELATKLGSNLSEEMKNKKWHLPSCGEAKLLMLHAGITPANRLQNRYNTYNNLYTALLNIAFTRVGGTAMAKMNTTQSIQPTMYWLSTQAYDTLKADGTPSANSSTLYLTAATMSRLWIFMLVDVISSSHLVRPFIYYKK